MQSCHIVEVGKRRDGGSRFWCLAHRADATAKYGKPLERCVAALDPVVTEEEIFRLNPQQFSGGVALWGAVPAVYDTTSLPLDRGIHVHARKERGGDKDIDRTFRAVVLPTSRDLLDIDGLRIDELDAIYYMVSKTFSKSMKYVACTSCGFPHLDRDWFSVHSHKRHLCHGCGKNFSDIEPGIGNPAVKLQEILNPKGPPKSVLAPNVLKINQRDFPGGIQIWGSNPAIAWSAGKPEEEGIHVHGYYEESKKPDFDDTCRSVTIDGICLDPQMVRYFMAQSAMPHIRQRVIFLICPACGIEHFDTQDFGFTPHDSHTCEKCQTEFAAPGKLKKTIGNPFVRARQSLLKFAVRDPQAHHLDLREESI